MKGAIAINPDQVPSTIEEAVEQLWAGMDSETEKALSGEVTKVVVELNGRDVEYPISPALHFHLGRQVRNTWSFWEDTPLRRDAIERYGIAHADDIWGLIQDWLAARARGDEEWKPEDTVERFRKHWERYGLTPLTAAGIDT